MFDGLDTGVQALFVPALDLARWIDRVRPYLDKMAEGSDGRYLTQDILADLARGQLFLWLAIKGGQILCAMTTQIIQYPRLRAMRCTGIVGREPRKWRHLLADVERSAKKNFGCDKMEALHQPRHGLLLNDGWETFHVLSQKALA